MRPILLVTSAAVLRVHTPLYAQPHSHPRVSAAKIESNYERDYNFIGQKLEQMSPQIVFVTPYSRKWHDSYGIELPSGTSRAEARETAKSTYDLFVTLRSIYFGPARGKQFYVIVGDATKN